MFKNKVFETFFEDALVRAMSKKTDPDGGNVAELISGAIHAARNEEQIGFAFKKLQSFDTDLRRDVLKHLEFTLFEDSFQLYAMAVENAVEYRLKPAEVVREMTSGNGMRGLLEQLQRDSQMLLHISQDKDYTPTPFSKALVAEMSKMSDDEYNSLEGHFAAGMSAYSTASGRIAAQTPAPKKINPFRPK